MNNEIEIEDAIIADTGALGFPDASAIRRVRVSPDSGVVDLMLLPSSSEPNSFWSKSKMNGIGRHYRR